MKIVVYKCSKCKEEIYSRARHDFNTCSCGNLSVDGGHYDEKRMTFFIESITGEIKADKRIVDIDVTPKQLYDDWNFNINKYGKLIGGN